MNYTTSFRGLAGEAIYTFVHPSSLPTVIGLLLLWVPIFLLLGSMAQLWGPLPPLLAILCIYSWLVGRFALPASQGYMQEGFFTTKLELGDGLAYAMRYLFALLLVLVPAGALGYYAAQNIGYQAMLVLGGASPALLLGGGFWGGLLIAAIVICLVSPGISLLVTTSAGSLGDLLMLAPWRWVILTRFPDVVVFYAALAGGMIAFMIIYVIPLTLLALLTLPFSPRAAMWVINGVQLLPLAGMPLLIGRLCGAFYFGTWSIEEGSAAAQNAGSDAAAAPSPAAAEASEEPVMSCLSENPSSQLVSALKDSLRRYDEVEMAALYQLGAAMALGVQFAEDTKLAKRLAVQKELQQLMRGFVTGEREVKVVPVGPEERERLEALALRIYRKKP